MADTAKGPDVSSVRPLFLLIWYTLCHTIRLFSFLYSFQYFLFLLSRQSCPFFLAFFAAKYAPSVQRICNFYFLAAHAAEKFPMHGLRFYFLRMLPIQLFAMLRTKLHSPICQIGNSYHRSAFETAKFSNNRCGRRWQRPYIVGTMPIGIALAFIAAIFLCWPSRRKFCAANRTFHL